ncbi:ATP-binding cassette domain-containing protein [Lachnobacterium bovis]|uniref:ABC-2 type transport system ATP-binding protein n=1 Tax=Lachnobacterium bovis DSM 14045 TaxID=1122142 RepID=A0A1H3GA29_9FIRM|nr:ABC transporter ATP-binding protein [Lachnobacterium bovis]SDY00111.1 ABC-2 type transport system ATP-binding protein [Lachnobacterium bovis DSM 14045]
MENKKEKKVVKHLQFFYNAENMVLEDVSFEIQGGEIVCINGMNGAGKTTLLKILAGVLDEYNMDANLKKFREDSIYISNAPDMYDNLSGRENAELLRALWKKNSLEFENNFKKYMKIFEVESYINDDLGDYSLGMKYKTFLAAVLSLEIPILLMDEPLNAMDSKSQKKAISVLKDYVSNGKNSIIFSSHIDTIVSELSSKVYHLKGGKLYEEE